MTTTEKLAAIKAHCKHLLAISEKRTPGEWKTSRHPRDVWSQGYCVAECDPEYESNNAVHDAAFIASAAVNFEASLRTTIAAIDAVSALNLNHIKTVESILAHWAHIL